MNIICWRCNREVKVCGFEWLPRSIAYIWWCGQCAKETAEALRQQGFWYEIDDSYATAKGAAVWIEETLKDDFPKRFKALRDLRLCCPQCGEFHKG
jgi:hypothetical protein